MKAFFLIIKVFDNKKISYLHNYIREEESKGKIQLIAGTTYFICCDSQFLLLDSLSFSTLFSCVFCYKFLLNILSVIYLNILSPIEYSYIVFNEIYLDDELNFEQ